MATGENQSRAPPCCHASLLGNLPDCSQHLAPFMPNKSAELFSKLHYTSQKEDLAVMNALTEGTEVQAGKPLFPKLKDLPPAIKKALGMEDKPKQNSKPTGPKKIKKSKCFKRFLFHREQSPRYPQQQIPQRLKSTQEVTTRLRFLVPR